MTTSDEQAIWEAVVESNRAWVEGRPAEVGRLYHEDAVAVFSGAGQRIAGRAAIVQSYVDYCRQARTHSFEELDHSVDVFGDAAAVSYRFAVRYELGGEVHDERGREVLLFVRRHGRWAAVWRTQVPAGG